MPPQEDKPASEQPQAPPIQPPNLHSSLPPTILTENSANETEAPKKAKTSGCFKKILLSFAIFIVSIFSLGVIIYFFHAPIANLFFKDIPPIDDSDLIPTARTVKDTDNAYFDLKDIVTTVDEPEEVLDYIALKKWDSAHINRILEQNQDMFARWDKAVHKKDFQDPLYADLSIPPPFKEGFPTVFTGYQKLARLNTLRGLNLINTGKVQEGIEVLFGLLEMGKKLNQSDSGLVPVLVGSAISSIGMQGFQTVTPHLIPQKNALIQFEERLNNFKFNTEGLKNGFRHEYFESAYGYDLMAKGENPNPNIEVSQSSSELGKRMATLAKNRFYFQPNKTKLLKADHIRKLIFNADTPCHEEKQETFQRDYKIVTDFYFRENGLGIVLFNTGSVDFVGIINSVCDRQADLSATKLLFALKAYVDEKKSLPQNLEVLVPIYISDVPIDPYDEKPFKYSVSKKIIYSVGNNRKDDGGEGTEDSLSSKDFVVPINF